LENIWILPGKRKKFKNIFENFLPIISGKNRCDIVTSLLGNLLTISERSPIKKSFGYRNDIFVILFRFLPMFSECSPVENNNDIVVISLRFYLDFSQQYPNVFHLEIATISLWYHSDSRRRFSGKIRCDIHMDIIRISWRFLPEKNLTAFSIRFPPILLRIRKILPLGNPEGEVFFLIDFNDENERSWGEVRGNYFILLCFWVILWNN
jgi:hypothetical protein